MHDIEKHTFTCREYFDSHIKEYCNDTHYSKYVIEPPSHYPCVGLMVYEPLGDIGSRYTMEEYVYLEDFSQE